ncbi:MAG: thiamine-phosphate kinase [Desulfobacterales bacterium]|nr:thiamine-phosphate kinase [Desulfobacterales bacterium]
MTYLQSEFAFIERIQHDCIRFPQGVIKGIGDDCAIFDLPQSEHILVTTDMLVEQIDFLRSLTSGFKLGYKSLMVNLSDIAAMGGTPRHCFVSIAIPKTCSDTYLDDVYQGIKHAAFQYGVNILGGDTSSASHDIVINITVVGTIQKNKLLTRDAAQLNDMICVTGCLGDSSAGLFLLLNTIHPRNNELKALIDAHQCPNAHIKQGQFLANSGWVHAAIDISDGFCADLGHILTSSHVGALIYEKDIPISDHLQWFAKEFQRSLYDFALSGGEDYVLICTVSPEHSDELCTQYQSEFQQPLYVVGKITDSQELHLIDKNGFSKPMSLKGWDHFKTTD